MFSLYVNCMIEHTMLFIINFQWSYDFLSGFCTIRCYLCHILSVSRLTLYRLLFQSIYCFYFRDDDVISVMIILVGILGWITLFLVLRETMFRVPRVPMWRIWNTISTRIIVLIDNDYFIFCLYIYIHVCIYICTFMYIYMYVLWG